MNNFRKFIERMNKEKHCKKYNAHTNLVLINKKDEYFPHNQIEYHNLNRIVLLLCGVRSHYPTIEPHYNHDNKPRDSRRDQSHYRYTGSRSKETTNKNY